ncbi:AI-2E family transporter [Paenibacillus alkalitolerans]|uniref:AI-2E family transporter n=1 Tax=Paenibacillus alkalitolerans TaxID=2799335 RepID=UPI0018F6780F|nr:AI-2E family transporter [Paenibacillus alkalitolerans]
MKEIVNNNFFRVGFGILLVILIIGTSINFAFIFHPFIAVLKLLFFPLLITVVLYYLLRPVVRFLVNRKMPKALAILLIYTASIALLTITFYFLAPMIKNQLTAFIVQCPSLIQSIADRGIKMTESEWFKQYVGDLNVDIQQYAAPVIDSFRISIQSALSFVTNTFIFAVIVPFILYYLLKDDRKIAGGLVRMLPKSRQLTSKRLLNKIDHTLSSYVRGQITVAACVGVLLLTGYLIIGIDYAILLALAAVVTNFIPYIGAFIAAAPAVLVAVAHSPAMVVKVIVVMVIAQQLEGNIVSPQILGKHLEIHPLTIILLVLCAGSLFGPLGLIMAVPFYAVGKIFVIHIRGHMTAATELEQLPNG